MQRCRDRTMLKDEPLFAPEAPVARSADPSLGGSSSAPGVVGQFRPKRTRPRALTVTVQSVQGADHDPIGTKDAPDASNSPLAPPSVVQAMRRAMPNNVHSAS